MEPFSVVDSSPKSDDGIDHNSTARSWNTKPNIPGLTKEDVAKATKRVRQLKNQQEKFKNIIRKLKI